MDLSVFFAGTGGAVPTPRRGLPATLIRAGGSRILVDCGEGTQRQLVRSVGLADMDDVFLTHYHADHWLGLPGLLKTFDLRDRDKPLTVYGPPGLKRIVNTLAPLVGRTTYPLKLVELERYDEVRLDGATMASFPVDHRSEAYGYAWIEDERPGRFDPQAARALGIAEGPDFGRLQRGETVDGVRPEQVVGPTRAGRRIVISGDTRPCAVLEEHAQDAELLIHEATFTSEHAERARETGHTTARQAAALAADAHVRLLCLTHLSPRTWPRDARSEARAVFDNVQVPYDFDIVEIPFPERGAPQLKHWDDVREQEQPSEEEALAT